MCQQTTAVMYGRKRLNFSTGFSLSLILDSGDETKEEGAEGSPFRVTILPHASEPVAVVEKDKSDSGVQSVTPGSLAGAVVNGEPSNVLARVIRLVPLLLLQNHLLVATI